MKKTLYAALFSIFAASASFAMEKPFFSGSTGFLATVTNTEPPFNAESYLAGQLDFSGMVFLRGEFYVQAGDICNEDTFSPIAGKNNAAFRIEELSATVKFNSQRASHYITLFNGNFEPIGSDLFLQRQFGIRQIRSNITDSYHGIEGSSIYPCYSIGGAYAIHTSKDNVFEASIYKNKALQDNNNDFNAVNFDFRYASLFSKATIDVLAGISLPIETKDDAGEDIFLMIREIQFHAGINALFGNKAKNMFYTQLGIDRLILKKGGTKSTDLTFKDFYVLLEDRGNIAGVNANFAVFNIPARAAGDMIYLRKMVMNNPTTESIIGCNLNLAKENLFIGNTKFSIGAHASFGVANISIDKLKDKAMDCISDSNKMLFITPYTNIEVFGGKISASLTVDCTAFEDGFTNAFTGTLGFKTNF